MAERARETDGQSAAAAQPSAGAKSVAPSAPIRVQIHTSLDNLPAPVLDFFAAAGAGNFCFSLPWFRTILRTAGPRGDEPRLYVAERGGVPVAALAVRERKAAGRLKAHMLLGPSHGLYALIYAPLLAGEGGMAGLRAIVAAIVRAAPAFDVLRFDCLDRRSAEFAALAAAFRRHGLLVRSFRNFDNAYEDVAGLTVEDYLARRSPRTRYFIGRHRRRLERSGRGRFALCQGGASLKAALVDYAIVDLLSWKAQEAYPDCVAELFDVAAAAGTLRLGLYYIDGEPAATQVWFVSAGRATLWRMHYARKFAALSVGNVLTLAMIRHLLHEDRVAELDFGAGEEAFKSKWLGGRRERAGLIVTNPWTSKGALASLWHMGGHAVAVPLRRLRRLGRRLIGGP